MSDECTYSGLPEPQGLYDPRNEHDACGIGFVANISGEKSHDIVVKGIEILINLTHRGACGCDPRTGDGAGVLIQIPHAFFEAECSRLGFPLPSPGEYGVGMVFLPVEPRERMSCEAIVEEIVRDEGLTVLGWRDTPVNSNTIGRLARSTQPYIEQVFVKRAYGMDEAALERKLYVIRKRAEKEVGQTHLREKSFFYIPSLSCRTIVYKGLLLAPQIANFYLELSNSEVRSGLCLVHQRFSTNTFPTWHLAHPYRYICHNGEINTLRGNVNWMNARTSILASPLFGDDIKKLEPIIAPGGSDSANLDNAVELLLLAGPQPSARYGDAHSAGLAERSHHAGRRQGVLRISRLADGALGRPRRSGLYRWPHDRRQTGPQWFAARPICGDESRPGDHGFRGRGVAS